MKIVAMTLDCLSSKFTEENLLTNGGLSEKDLLLNGTGVARQLEPLLLPAGEGFKQLELERSV